MRALNFFIKLVANSLIVSLTPDSPPSQYSHVQITTHYMRSEVCHRQSNTATAYERIVHQVSWFHLCLVCHQECKFMIGRGRTQVRSLTKIILGEERLALSIPLWSYFSTKDDCVVPGVINHVETYFWAFQINILWIQFRRVKSVDYLELLSPRYSSAQALYFKHEFLILERIKLLMVYARAHKAFESWCPSNLVDDVFDHDCSCVELNGVLLWWKLNCAVGKSFEIQIRPHSCAWCIQLSLWDVEHLRQTF